MKIQNILLMQLNEKLVINWDLFFDTKVITINVANDSEFTVNPRYLSIPKATNATLDVGQGVWYVRIGCWIPSPKTPSEGALEWSGIVGPIQIVTQKPMLPTIRRNITIIYNQSIAGGLRLHTGKYENYYAIAEYTTGNFEASSTKTLYTFDSSRGYVDVIGLLKQYTYNVRIAHFGALPTTVHQLSDWITIRNKQPTILQKPLDGTDLSKSKSDLAILNDTSVIRGIRFSSGTERANYLAAKARTQSMFRRL